MLDLVRSFSQFPPDTPAQPPPSKLTNQPKTNPGITVRLFPLIIRYRVDGFRGVFNCYSVLKNTIPLIEADGGMLDLKRLTNTMLYCTRDQIFGAIRTTHHREGCATVQYRYYTSTQYSTRTVRHVSGHGMPQNTIKKPAVH